MDYNQKHIGNKIKEARLQIPDETCKSCGHLTKKSNQSELAKYLGISRSFLSMVEDGKYKLKPMHIVLLCKYVKKPIEYFTNSTKEINEYNKIKEKMKNI